MAAASTGYEKLVQEEDDVSLVDAVQQHDIIGTPQLQVSEDVGGNSRFKYKKILFGFGVAETVLGCLSALLAIIALAIASQNKTYKVKWPGEDKLVVYKHFNVLTYTCQGIWGGIFLVTTGILGIRVRSTPSVRMHKANMVMSIVTGIVMGMVVILSVGAAGMASSSYHHRLYSIITIHSILACLGFIAFVLCVVHSAYCCAGVCCGQKPIEAFAIQPYHLQQDQQIVQLPDGQFMTVPRQSVSVSGHSYASAMVTPGPVIGQLPQSGGTGVPQITVPQQATIVNASIM